MGYGPWAMGSKKQHGTVYVFLLGTNCFASIVTHPTNAKHNLYLLKRPTSPSWNWTNDPMVNSHLLYRWAIEDQIYSKQRNTQPFSYQYKVWYLPFCFTLATSCWKSKSVASTVSVVRNTLSSCVKPRNLFCLAQYPCWYYASTKGKQVFV